MNANVNDITVTSLETITAFDVITGDYLFTLDELQNATISQTQDEEEITGKQGRRLNTLKRNKAVTISGTNGMVSAGLLELQTGGKFVNKVTTVLWPDYVVVQGGRGETEYRAVGAVGNEITNAYVRNADGTLGKTLTQGTEAGPGVYTYDPATRAVVFDATDAPDGCEVVMYYMRQIQADVLDNMSDTYSGKATLYIDAFGEDKCNNVYRIQFYVPKADFNGEFDIEFGDSQTVHAFEAQSLAGAGCGLHNASGMLWTYTVFGEKSVDVATGSDNMTVKTGQEDAGYEKKAEDLMEDDVRINWEGTSGTVYGTFKKVTGWNQLPGTPKEGHFFAMSIDNRYLGKPFTYINETAGTTSTVPSASADEMYWVLCIDNNKKFTFKSGDEIIASLDFTNAILAD